MPRLGVVGVGVMGEAIVRGLRDRGWAGDDIVVCDAVKTRQDEVVRGLGVRAAADAAEVAASADQVLLAVKPPDAREAAASMGASAQGGTLGLLSIVAMTPIDRLREWSGGRLPVVRAMPNMPASIGKGVTALAAGQDASEAGRAQAQEVFEAVGPVVWVREDLLDAVTAVSGSGPAYVFLMAEAMVDAGVNLGLSRDVASTLAFATIEGAATLLRTAGEHPAVLRNQVTTPGGTTAAALAVMEAMALRSAFIEGIRAAWSRSRSS